jgi:uncharacterized protein YeaO (DUF488 family)
MQIEVQRIYDEPKKGKTLRLLVDRLWPRGIKKEYANIDDWAKGLAPSKDLFTWFHADKENRFKDFQKK